MAAAIEKRYEVKDPESGCSCRVDQFWDVTDGQMKFAISFDHGPHTIKTESELITELERVPGIKIGEACFHGIPKFAAYELLRRHLSSDAHADLSYVELATR